MDSVIYTWPPTIPCDLIKSQVDCRRRMTTQWQEALSAFENEWKAKLKVNCLENDNQQAFVPFETVGGDQGYRNNSEARHRYVENRMKIRFQKSIKKPTLTVPFKRFALMQPNLEIPNAKYTTFSCQQCQSSINGIVPRRNEGGITNLLELPILTERKRYFGFFPYIGFIRSRKLYCYKKLSIPVVVDSSVKKVFKQIGTSERRLTTLGDQQVSAPVFCKDVSDQTQRVLELAKTIYKNMAADISNAFLRIVGWVLLKVFRKCYSNICFQLQDIEFIRQADKMKVPIIYLPLHKSHLDYLIISLVLFCNDIKVPHTAAGDNLWKVPIVGFLLRKVGAFFIRRTNNGREAVDAASYNAVLQEYMEQLLRNSESIAIFIEGTRTRCGKPLHPKTGLLSCITQAVFSGTIPDALVVPVGISYDLIPEHAGYAREAIGAPKEPESIWQLLRSAFRMIRSNNGQIRVNFGKPYSVKSFCDKQPKFSAKVYRESPKVSESASSMNKILCMTQGMLETTKALGYHVINDSEMICNQMATNMVAFLMLTLHRDGVPLYQLVDSFTWLREELSSLNRFLGFSCNSWMAVEYAVQLLDKADMLELTENENGKTEDAVVSLPSARKDHLALVQHGNQVAPAFIRKAIVGCALVCSAGGFQQLLITKQARIAVVTLEEVKRKSQWLAQLLSREFIVAPPCTDFDSWFQETLQTFLFADIIKNKENQIPITNRERNIASNFDLYDTDATHCFGPWAGREVEYEVILTEDNTEVLKFYHAIVAPLVESYWLTAAHLLSLLPDKQKTVSTFLSEVHTFAQNRVVRGFTQYAETASSFPIANAVQFLEDVYVITSTNDDKNSKIILLSPQYQIERTLVDFIASIDTFR